MAVGNLIALRTAHLVVEIDVDSGGEIRTVRRPEGANALASYDWESPAPAVAGAGYGDTRLDWLSRYRGRWQGLFPNAGAESEALGVPVAFHGETSSQRWDVVAWTAHQCTIRTAARLPLTIERTITLDEDAAVVRVEERVANESDLEVPFLWGHHPAFPAVTGARIDLPRCTVEPEPSAPGDLAVVPTAWPDGVRADGSPRDLRVLTGETTHRLLYLSELAEPWAALRQPSDSEAPSVALAWSGEAFPALWVWLLDGTDEFPWYGRARMIAIEPQTASPFDGLAAARERGQAHVLGAREQREAWITLALLDDGEAAVVRVGRDGRVETAS